MKHSILPMISVIAFLFASTVVSANDKPVFLTESATGVLQKVSSNGDVVKFKCVPPNGDIYIVTLNSAARLLTVERPDLWVVTGSPVHAYTVKDATERYSFSTGTGLDYAYDFGLVLPRDKTKPTRFYLVDGAAASLTCVSQN